jgi:FKBP-type peptidyl-prolyl cis-trans isomerase FklB
VSVRRHPGVPGWQLTHRMRIVRAMKQILHRTIRFACAGAVILWAAPLQAVQPANQTAAPQSAPPQTPPASTPAAPPPPAAPEIISDQEASYLFGLTFAEQLRRVGVGGQVSTESLMRGVKDALGGKSSTPDDNRKIQQYVNAAMRAAADRNQAAAADFLAKNGTKKDVKTTASGLQYKVIKPGDASAAAVLATDTVEVNYRGRLLDGTEFDSSYARGTPATFPVGGVIKGWTEALQLMKPGASYVLYIPPELAYGAMGKPPKIPANSLLVFDVELLSVKAKPAAAPAPPAPPPAPAPPKQ